MMNAKIHTRAVAAAKAGMSLSTAKRYIRNGGEIKKAERTRTRPDPFAHVWPELRRMLEIDHGLQAKTLMEWLMENYPEEFHQGQLRTLQRCVRNWRLLGGPDKEVMFRQVHEPGKQSQSDVTDCRELGVEINSVSFPHRLYHFMLPYSRWETAYIVHTESFDVITQGYATAVRELGFVAEEHRTDNHAAAVTVYGDKKEFNQRWVDFLKHYGVEPSSNNAYKAHENGSVEKSHDLLKTAIDQRLRLRGSRNFNSLEEYQDFLKTIINQRNLHRYEKLQQEIKVMKHLPAKDWDDPKIEQPKVTGWSTITVSKSTYSVPSRFIGSSLKALVYHDRIKLYLGQTFIEEIPRLPEGEKRINYRHIISSLVRKPGAFARYQYREELFPSLVFRKAYDQLTKHSPADADKQYLKILHQAAMNTEIEVELALELLFESEVIPTVEEVKALVGNHTKTLPTVNVFQPNIRVYDNLLPALVAV